MKNELSFSEIEMTRSCAKDLTDRINSTSEDLAGMLKRAHDEKAWQALGYETWNAYVKAEIKLCKSRVFQLLDYETIRQELAESTIVDLPLPTKEAVTRELKKAPPAERAEKYAKAVVLSGGKEPTAKTIKAVVEQQEQPIKQAQARVIEGEVVRKTSTLKELDKTASTAVRALCEAAIRSIKGNVTLEACSSASDWLIECECEISIFHKQLDKLRGECVPKESSK